LTRQIKSFEKSSNRADGPSPAVAYVRMSTDLQQFSTENQLQTIRKYAEQRGYEIKRVFEDSGRSGLNIDGRDGLNSLMLEVQSGTADFQAILV
jgi:DNA invertase Pin-like site-specific DNA recombinase